MIIENKDELATLRESGKRLALVLQELKHMVKPGISTGLLDQHAEKRIRELGGDPVFKGYKAYGSQGAYPGSVCISINDEIVHGIPSEGRIIKEGDIVGLDIGMRYPSKTGLITDTALTVGAGKISKQAEVLMKATRESLMKGIAAAKAGNTIGDIGYAIQAHLEGYSLGIIRELVGHGVGHKLHEDPYVPNYGRKGSGEKLREGMVLALEPMATLGSPAIKLAKDGWTYQTKDGSLSAHFEHTIIIGKGPAEVVTLSA